MEETGSSSKALARRALWLALAATALAGPWLMLGAGEAAPREESLLMQLPSAEQRQPSAETRSPTSERLLVYVAGAVSRPGVYSLEQSARLVDALRAAGGPLAQADLQHLNLAARLVDAEKIYVPELGEQLREEPAEPEREQGVTLVDLNTAGVRELEELPRIGATTAQRILEHRQANGPCQQVDDLLEIPGIGPALLEAIRPLVYCG